MENHQFYWENSRHFDWAMFIKSLAMSVITRWDHLKTLIWQQKEYLVPQSAIEQTENYLVCGMATRLKNMKVNWNQYSQYMGNKQLMFQTTNQFCCNTPHSNPIFPAISNLRTLLWHRITLDILRPSAIKRGWKISTLYKLMFLAGNIN